MTENDLEPCQYFDEGQIVYILCRLQAYDFKLMWIPVKVMIAAGHSAYVENQKYKIAHWTDLRCHEVMIRKNVIKATESA